jgi:hypothetical protein
LHNVLNRMGTKKRRNRHYNVSIPFVLAHKMPTLPLMDKYWDTLA